MLFYIVLTPISTTSGLLSICNMRKYHQIDVYIYQCDINDFIFISCALALRGRRSTVRETEDIL